MDAPPWRFTLPANPQPEMFMMDRHINSSNLRPMFKHLMSSEAMWHYVGVALCGCFSPSRYILIITLSEPSSPQLLVSLALLNSSISTARFALSVTSCPELSLSSTYAELLRSIICRSCSLLWMMKLRMHVCQKQKEISFVISVIVARWSRIIF